MATYTLATPLTVGDLVNRISVDKLVPAAVSCNIQGLLNLASPSAIVSVVLQHLGSGWTMNLIYTGTDGVTVWNAFKAANFSASTTTTMDYWILNRLKADGKLPAGTVS